jgi:hypothetical protein
MKRNLLLIVIVLFCADVFGATDHFPIKSGNIWLFTYRNTSGSWGNSTTDSGTILWKIVDIDTSNSIPGKITVSVAQTRNLCRRSFIPGFKMPDDTKEYDSVFVPSRTTTDTILLTGLLGGNGLAFKNDTCWSFVHDPRGATPAGMLSIRDTMILYRERPTVTAIIDPRPYFGEKAKYVYLWYFITARGLGPIEYHRQSPVGLMDYRSEIHWKLASTNVGEPVAIDDRHSHAMVYVPKIQIYSLRKRIVIDGFISQPGTIIASLYLPNGRLLSSHECSFFSAGQHQIVIWHTTQSSLAVILNVELPDGKSVRQRLWLK